MQNLKSDVISYLKHLRNIPLSSRVRKIAIDNDMHKESIFSYSSKEEKTHLESLLNEDRSVVLDRVVGSLVGLAVADALGNFAMSWCSTSSSFVNFIIINLQVIILSSILFVTQLPWINILSILLLHRRHPPEELCTTLEMNFNFNTGNSRTILRWHYAWQIVF